MADAHEQGLVRTGRQRHPFGQHGVEEAGVQRLVGGLRLGEVGRQPGARASAGAGAGASASASQSGAEVHAHQCAHHGEAGGQPSGVAGLLQHIGQPFSTACQLDVHLGGELVECGQAGSSGERVTGQGAGVEHRTERRQRFHHLATAAHSANGQPTADDLAEGGEVGSHTEVLLRSTHTEPETGDHLIEHQQCAHPVAFGTKALEEPWCGGHDAHVGRHGFHEHGCHLLVELRHHVVGHHKCVGNGAGRHTSRTGQAEGGDARPTGCQECIGSTVEVAVEDDDAIAAGEPAGQPHRGTGGFGAAVHEPHTLATGHALANGFGQLHLTRGGGAIRRATCSGFTQCSGDSRVSMAEDDGAVALHQVDVASALHIHHIRAFSSRHQIGRTAYGTEGTDARVHAARNGLSRTGEQCRVGGDARTGAGGGRATRRRAGGGVAEADAAHAIPAA